MRLYPMRGSLLFSLLPSLTLCQTCYNPQGNQANVPLAGSSWTVCPSSEVCCLEGDLCFTDGFCLSQLYKAWYRGMCADSSWGSTCPSQCKNLSDSGYPFINSCGIGEACCAGADGGSVSCCDQAFTRQATIRQLAEPATTCSAAATAPVTTSDSTCATAETVTVTASILIQTVAGGSTLTTSTVMPTLQPTSTAASSNSTTPQPDGLTEGAKAGIGAGVGVGVLAIILATTLLYLARKRKARTVAQSPAVETEARQNPVLVSSMEDRKEKSEQGHFKQSMYEVAGDPRHAFAELYSENTPHELEGN